MSRWFIMLLGLWVLVTGLVLAQLEMFIVVLMVKSTISDGFCTTSDGIYTGCDSVNCKLVDAMGGAPEGNDLSPDMLMMVMEMMVVGAL